MSRTPSTSAASTSSPSTSTPSTTSAPSQGSNQGPPIDCMLWGSRNAVYQGIILRTCAALKNRGISCETVLEYLPGNTHLAMMRCIERASSVVLFVTKEYREFRHAYNQKTVRGLIPVVLEADMRDQKQWTGFLQIALGRSPFLDMSGDLADEEYFNSQVELLRLAILDVVASTPNVPNPLMTPIVSPLDRAISVKNLSISVENQSLTNSATIVDTSTTDTTTSSSRWSILRKSVLQNTSSSAHSDTTDEASVTNQVTTGRHSKHVSAAWSLIFDSIKRGKMKPSRPLLDTVVHYDGGVYKGVLVDSKFHGYGRYEHKSGNVYEGEFADGKKHGKAVYTFKDGHVYEGEYRENKRCGFGVMRYANGSVYEGEWMDNLQHGHGKLTYADGDVYEGEHKRGQFWGKGVYHYADGSVYIGQFEYDNRSGYGTFTDKDGNVYEGEWKEDKFDGNGTMRYANGDTHKGLYRMGVRQGKGRHVWLNGDVYEGTYVNDRQEKVGIYRFHSGGEFEGVYRKGRFVPPTPK